MSTQANIAALPLESARPRLGYAALMLGHMSQGLAFTAFIASLPQMAREFGEGGEFIAQMSLALVALGLMAGAVVSGWILELAGSRGTLIGALLAYGILGSGGLLLKNPALLLATRFGVGFACACLVTTCVWGIAAMFQSNQRARALGVSAALASFSALAATLIGGQLAHYGGWRLAFIQYPCFAALALYPVLLGIRQVRPPLGSGSAAALPFFLGLLPFYLLASFVAVIMFMGSTQFAFLLEIDGVVDPGKRSLVLACVTVTSTLTSFSYGLIEKRLGSARAFACALLSASLGLGLAGLTSTITLAIASAVFIGIYVGIVIPFIHHVVTEKSHVTSRSRAIGLLTAFNFLGGFLNPILLAPLAKAVGLRGAFVGVAAILGLCAIGSMLLLMRDRSRARTV